MNHHTVHAAEVSLWLMHTHLAEHVYKYLRGHSGTLFKMWGLWEQVDTNGTPGTSGLK